MTVTTPSGQYEVELWAATAGVPGPVARYTWTAEQGVRLEVHDPQWADFARRVLADGVSSRARDRVVSAAEGPVFLAALSEIGGSYHWFRWVRAAPELPSDEAPAPAGGAPQPNGRPAPHGPPPSNGRPVPDGPRTAGPDSPAAATSPAPLARTRDEALLFLTLQPCPGCGATAGPSWDSALVSHNGQAARQYTGACPDCGSIRDYVFTLPELVRRPAGTPPWSRFGGPEASRLIDAGQWLWVADRTAERSPSGDLAADRRYLDLAAAAMDEILKFIPDSAAHVPETGFWTEQGRAVRAAEPGRFRADRLAVVRDYYRGRLTELAAAGVTRPRVGRGGYGRPGPAPGRA